MYTDKISRKRQSARGEVEHQQGWPRLREGFEVALLLISCRWSRPDCNIKHMGAMQLSKRDKTLALKSLEVLNCDFFEDGTGGHKSP